MRVLRTSAGRSWTRWPTACASWRQTDDEWEAAIARVRALAAACFDGDAAAVALVPSAAYGIAIAVRNLPLAHGDGVLVTASAFPSQVLAWQQRCDAVGARMLRRMVLNIGVEEEDVNKAELWGRWTGMNADQYAEGRW